MKHLTSVSKKPAYAIQLPSALCDLKAQLADVMQENFNIDCPCYADKCGEVE